MNDKALPAWDLSDLYDGIEDEKLPPIWKNTALSALSLPAATKGV